MGFFAPRGRGDLGVKPAAKTCNCKLQSYRQSHAATWRIQTRRAIPPYARLLRCLLLTLHHVLYECIQEVTLRRRNSDDRLGLTLYYRDTHNSGTSDVIVGEVSLWLFMNKCTKHQFIHLLTATCTSKTAKITKGGIAHITLTAMSC